MCSGTTKINKYSIREKRVKKFRKKRKKNCSKIFTHKNFFLTAVLFL